jgi:hypothetical protein
MVLATSIFHSFGQDRELIAAFPVAQPSQRKDDEEAMSDPTRTADDT